MVRAWFMADVTGKDQRDPLMLDPPEDVDLEYLREHTHVLYFKLDPKNYEEELGKIRKERGYTYQDELICSPDKLPNYEDKLKMFFVEHLHRDEEIRFVLEGSGYFDVRDPEDRWIRIHVLPGDLLVLPAGIYHRFTLDHTTQSVFGESKKDVLEEMPEEDVRIGRTHEDEDNMKSQEEQDHPVEVCIH
ncbi:unnamed protein product [Darwinula stevensoni]|uniref:Acireductone dioxygenase n=1 Tax=Darwinula stevensoni TaxID=69355 RepID=A0A7R8X6K3_9CRUS|nr:unnamed protein product [Darwinula stevensoni]CAG0881386.1 unnamed protein product [Darwinula stevensoni]